MLLKIFSNFGKIVAQEVHDYQILFTVFDKVVDIANMLETLQTDKDVVLKDENAFVFIFLLDFQSHIFSKLLVISLVNET